MNENVLKQRDGYCMNEKSAKVLRRWVKAGNNPKVRRDALPGIRKWLAEANHRDRGRAIAYLDANKHKQHMVWDR